jgi:hypothetical protein
VKTIRGGLKVNPISNLAGCFLIVNSFFVPAAIAEMSDSYNIRSTKISEQVLKDSIGVLTVSPMAGGGPNIKVYRHSDDKFVFWKSLSVLQQTKAVSGFECRPDRYPQNSFTCHFPLVAQIDNFFLIVINPETNRRAWINRKEAEKDWSIDITFFEASHPKCCEDLVDIFFFTESDKRNLYQHPSPDSPFKVIGREAATCVVLKTFRNGFVQLAHIGDKSTNKPERSLGWVRLRDDKGRLTVWPHFTQFCYPD